MDVTLVAYYGNKADELDEFVTNAQNRLVSCLGDVFRPYDSDQVHCTIIGLEGLRAADHIFNTNYMKLRRQFVPMDLWAVVTEVVQGSQLLPLKIQVGGYQAEHRYSFTSRGLHPFIRSFSIQGDIAVAMGWPVDGNSFPLSLERLRRAFNIANVLHKYHASDGDIDNDLFFVLGRIDRAGISEFSLKEAQDHMREFLAEQKPLTLDLRLEHLSIVAYLDSTLPPQGSRVFPLNDARRRLDEIKALYGALPSDVRQSP